MPADMMEKNSSSPVAATPASMNTVPDKPKTASEHRKVGFIPQIVIFSLKTIFSLLPYKHNTLIL